MPAATHTATVVLLIVEDSSADFALTKHALEASGVAPTVLAARDGEEAMAMLRGGPPPDLILLDLNLPRKSGLEVLAELAGDAELRRIPVVVLSSSAAHKDVEGSTTATPTPTWSSRWTWTSSSAPCRPCGGSGSRSSACRPSPTAATSAAA
jgi:CheY-like chemotaxis protein